MLLMLKKVYIYKSECNYPKSNATFRPDVLYPEYLWATDISTEKNSVYAAIRNVLLLAKLDKENIGTSKWNPLKEYVKPGNIVLIKPNLVHEQDKEHVCGEALYVQPSIIAAIIDYVIIALKGTGKIIIGDAPVQSCNFPELIKQSGYDMLVEYYQKKGIDISIRDFRTVISSFDGNLPIWTYDDSKKESNTYIDLADNSFFSSLDDDQVKNLRITNYNPDELKKYHSCHKHEYSITNEVFEADVVINVIKPKTHRKAGVTLSLKNFVGIISQKECLPHHRNGSVNERGDEYRKKSLLLRARAYCLDKKNNNLAMGKNRKARLFDNAARAFSTLSRKISKENYREGAWYGNDTIWRMVLDINNVVQNYLNKDGKRKVLLAFADMIVAGENDGPLYPSSKKSGVVAFSDGLVAFDEAITTIMGFDYKLIPVIYNASKYEKLIFGCQTESIIISNYLPWNEKKCGEIKYKDTLQMDASKNWKGYCELNSQKDKNNG